ncbi:hypothetical protein KM043_008885 [Ampulex compressa]|nr:hypothetical protein KM043_008885 [Ampulex compressa]
MLSKNQNNGTDPKMLSGNDQVLDKVKGGQKIDQPGNKGRITKLPGRAINAAMGNKEAPLGGIAATPTVTVVAGRMNVPVKKGNGVASAVEGSKSGDQQLSKNPTIAAQQGTTTFGNVRGVNECAVAHEPVPKPKDFNAKKFPPEIDPKTKNYRLQADYKESSSVNSQDYKPRSGNPMNNLQSRFVGQASVQSLHRESHGSGGGHHSRPASRNDNTAFAVARKALESTAVPKMAPINFPPLRAPQSIVNVRHPFVTEARTKHNEIGGSSAKSKLNVVAGLQSGPKDLDHGRQTFHSYGTSQLAGIPSVQNLNNVAANISPYPRPDTFPQPTVASVLFPETAQFPQSPPFSTTQLGQLNQYQTYDPGSFATTPVNVNPVIPQFSAESSIPYPQYENPPQFVQPNHYPTADIASNQYQYQAAGVGQLQDSPMFIQSLQSPIAVTDQYAGPNYARAVRTELIPRLRRPPRFNK